MPAFDHTFEELPLFRTEDGAYAAGRVDGGCDVSFTSPEDFQISDIYLVVDNGRNGTEARWKRHYLNISDPAFWCRIHDAIMERYRDRIEERISEEMMEAA